jgi:hypothetical protein
MDTQGLWEYLRSELTVSEQANLWNTLGIRLIGRFGRTCLVRDIDVAIMMEEKAVALALADDPHRVCYVNNLSVCITEPIRQNRVDGRPRSCDRDDQANSGIELS